MPRCADRSHSAPIATQSGRSDAEVYRRQARRLRQRYAAQPSLLHFSLCELSRRHDRAHPAPRPAGRSVDSLPLRPSIQRVQPKSAGAAPDSSFARAVVDWFGDQVAGEFDGKLLHHTNRQRLLKTAERLGISRFNANLVIAVAQNNAEQGNLTSTSATLSKPRWSFPLIAMIAIVQSLIVWGAWHVLH